MALVTPSVFVIDRSALAPRVSASVAELLPGVGSLTPAAAVTVAVFDSVPVAAAEIAQLAERLGYTRYWLAEHHNMEGVASTATAVLIGFIASKTHTLRVGSGGIMLPNHAPLVVAEQFGTLATLYPNRIDLGLGRAPGTDQQTARALRRDRSRRRRIWTCG